MDKLNQSMDETLQQDEIPLLEDIVLNDSNEPPPTQKAGSSDDHQANPFLPYEHLAKLALEREKFTQSIEAFTENLKHEKTHRKPGSSSQEASILYKNDAIVQAITTKVLNQLKPVIEEKIAAELSLYFDDIVDEY